MRSYPGTPAGRLFPTRCFFIVVDADRQLVVDAARLCRRHAFAHPVCRTGCGIRGGRVAEGLRQPLRTDAGCEDSGVLQGLHSGTFSSRGNAVFPLCRGQLLFFAGRDDAAGTLIRAPRYSLEYPSEKEVEEYLESPGGFAMENRFRRTPKTYHRYPLVFDDHGRLWVVTNRERDEDASFLDVYSGPEYWGAVRVRHDAPRSRCSGFDARSARGPSRWPRRRRRLPGPRSRLVRHQRTGSAGVRSGVLSLRDLRTRAS